MSGLNDTEQLLQYDQKTRGKFSYNKNKKY